jgi:peptidoglycan/xylan/chitin deacetylase (PgdA/CDA1 family)
MRNLPVLMYHRICGGDEKAHSKYVVDVEVFRAQLRYFAEQGYYTPNLADVLANNGRSLLSDKKPLLITFDDGYLDTYEYALPALREFGFIAVVFVVTDLARRTNWWDAPKHIAEARLMDPHHMHEMRKQGIEFGAHGVNHRSLPLLSDEELEYELQQSKTEAETILGQPIQFFAYPYGEVDERVKVATIGAGYSCAFASNSGPLSFHTDLFEIRRVLIASNANPAYLYLKLSGVEKAFKWSEWVGKKVLGKQPAYIF